MSLCIWKRKRGTHKSRWGYRLWLESSYPADHNMEPLAQRLIQRKLIWHTNKTLRTTLLQATTHTYTASLWPTHTKILLTCAGCHRETQKHTQCYGAPWRVLYNISADISSDFTHLEAGQSSHLFGRSKNSRPPSVASTVTTITTTTTAQLVSALQFRFKCPHRSKSP